MATDQSICYEFDGRVTWEAVRQHINCDRNVHWRRLLRVSAMREQEARLLIHSRDSPASSRLECGLAHTCVVVVAACSSHSDVKNQRQNVDVWSTTCVYMLPF